MKITIDAQGKKLGRIASEAAAMLRGKNRAAFTRNALPQISVEIVNAGKLAIAERKSLQTRFTRASGYPGGFKQVTVREFLVKRGSTELVRRTVLGMLPKNRLRSRLIKNLLIKN